MKGIVALDIGSSAIAGVELRADRAGAVRLHRAAVESLPAGLVRDGEIQDPEALATEIKEFWRQSKFAGRRVRLGVANGRVIVRNIDVPAYDDPADVRAAVEQEAAEQIPTPAEGSIVDYQPVMRYLDESSVERERCVVVSGHRDMLETLTWTVRKAGLQPVGIDLEAFAILRAVLPPPALVDEGSVDSQAVLVCHVGAEVTNLIVAVDRNCHFTRLVGFGGTQLTRAVAERVELPLPEAEALKNACGLLGEPPEDWNKQTVAEVRHALALGARPLAREISRSLEFYRSQTFARPVGKVVLAGGTALCAGLDRYLQQALGIATEVGDPRPQVEGAATLGAEVASRAAVALGLALDAPELS